MWKIVFATILLAVHDTTQLQNDLFNLTVVHLNDFHARFEETSDDGATCKTNHCIGGFSRLYTAIEAILDKSPNHLLLNAGDNFQGTLWYNLFKWNVTQHFLNKLPFDATVLGNHEFDDGIAGVVPFIQSLQSPVVVANLNDTLEPTIQNTYRKSVVVQRDGRKIGIIGVILKTTNEIARTENLAFFDESESVNAEAERLVREEGVFTNIVLSHCGYEVEQSIASKATAASKITLVVGGHSHTFLYTGEPVPGPAVPAGPYPTVVSRLDDSQPVLVVQASAYCRYLGNVVISYDQDGNCVDWSGQPVFLDTTSKQDNEVNRDLQPWKSVVDKYGNKVLGQSLVALDESTCRYAECLLGDFVADAMVYSYTDMADNSSWTYASIAVYNSGGLRTTIPPGNITYNDMITAQPFGNTFDVGEIQGRYIWEMFEFSMTPYSYEKAYIDVNMLQISGFHVVANLSKPTGSRIESIKVRCNQCTIPIYEELDLAKTYRLIMPSFLLFGGDGFVVIRDHLKNVRTGRVDIDVYTDYLGHKSPIFKEIEGRVVIVGSEVQYRNLFV